MVDRIVSYFLTEPGRLRGFGAHLFQCGAFLGVAGLISNLFTTAIGVTRSLSGQPASPVMIADLFPNLPTWWVPESFAGALITLMLVVVGLSLAHYGKQLDKLFTN